MEDNQLYHWGIKGQRWGVRRWQNKDGSLTPAGKKRYDDDNGRDGSSEDSKRAHDTTKKVGDMDDNELRSRINRLQMEDQYAKLMTPPPSTIQKVGSWLGGIAKESAKDIIKGRLTEWGGAYVDSWIGGMVGKGENKKFGSEAWREKVDNAKLNLDDRINSTKYKKSGEAWDKASEVIKSNGEKKSAVNNLASVLSKAAANKSDSEAKTSTVLSKSDKKDYAKLFKEAEKRNKQTIAEGVKARKDWEKWMKQKW